MTHLSRVLLININLGKKLNLKQFNTEIKGKNVSLVRNPVNKYGVLAILNFKIH